MTHSTAMPPAAHQSIAHETETFIAARIDTVGNVETRSRSIRHYRARRYDLLIEIIAVLNVRYTGNSDIAVEWIAFPTESSDHPEM